jgi:hypothetical protein
VCRFEDEEKPLLGQPVLGSAPLLLEMSTVSRSFLSHFTFLALLTRHCVKDGKEHVRKGGVIPRASPRLELVSIFEKRHIKLKEDVPTHSYLSIAFLVVTIQHSVSFNFRFENLIESDMSVSECTTNTHIIE